MFDERLERRKRRGTVQIRRGTRQRVVCLGARRGDPAHDREHRACACEHDSHHAIRDDLITPAQQRSDPDAERHGHDAQHPAGTDRAEKHGGQQQPATEVPRILATVGRTPPERDRRTRQSQRERTLRDATTEQLTRVHEDQRHRGVHDPGPHARARIGHATDGEREHHRRGERVQRPGQTSAGLASAQGVEPHARQRDL